MANPLIPIATTVATGAAIDYLRDTVTHHPNQYTKEIAGKILNLKEEAASWNAHKIKITVLFSPDHKIDGISVEAHTWHAKSARENCFKQLEDIIKNTYK